MLCGSHEQNTDALMVLYIDAESGSITLISIPRDLYFRGRRVNSYYHYFGPDRLMDVIGEIIGRQIEKYVSVDMYAFIDVVNILGGIDVTLEEDLIDPTYKVRNDGVWGTLYYPAGTHHLNGVEALRIARARHFTPVLSRDDRQQRIIKSIKEKLDALTLKDAVKIQEIVRTMFQYVDTNITAREAMEFYIQFRDFPIDKRIVLSTSNVLYDSYSNVYFLEEGAENLPDDYDKGAWILLPLENNWDLVPRYIEQVLQGDIDG